jgi:hypothetical protein
LNPIVDTTLEPSRILVSNYTDLEIRDDWELFGFGGSFLACDSQGVYITAMGANNYQGISSYSWDGTHLWTLEDSIILGDRQIVQSIGNSPSWAIRSLNSELVVAYWHNIVFMHNESNYENERIEIGSISCITESSFTPLDFYSINDDYLFAWSLLHDLPSAALSYTDKELNCLWELSISEHDDVYTLSRVSNNQEPVSLLTVNSLPYRPTLNIACAESTILINLDWQDTILELDYDGRIICELAGNHVALSERGEHGPPRARSCSRSIIGKIEYLGDDMLAILYGAGAFASDSSEIWCVDLNTGNYGILPFPQAVTTFSATMDNIVISSCSFSQDSSGSFWMTTEGAISTASWDLTAIRSTRE